MIDNPTEKSAILIEALPYLQRFRGKTFLIKAGGSAMEDPNLVRKMMRDVVFLEAVGINPVVVHGGGKAISAAMAEAGIEARFVGGMRVTTEDAVAVVEKTLHGKVNADLVAMINENGGSATGLEGKNIFQAERICAQNETGDDVDIGCVGKVTSIDLSQITEAIAKEVVPVVSPLASEEKTQQVLNVNADLAAAALACALKPAKLVFLSDVPGLLQDPSDRSTLIASVNCAQAQGLIDDGTISGGMLPKINSAMEALDAGVEKVHFIDGCLAHSLLLEIFTQSGIGTEIVA